MNLSKVIETNSLSPEAEAIDRTPWLRHREAEILRTIEAIEAIKGSNYWKFLEETVFMASLETLMKKLRNEKDETEIYRLQGQIAWCEKYADISKMAVVYRKELENIRKQLKN